MIAEVKAGDLVREARRRAGLTQRQLAQRAGVTQPTVARIEGGDVEASFDRVVALIRATGFDLDVHVVPLDEDALSMAQQNLERSPDERLDALLAALELRPPERDG